MAKAVGKERNSEGTPHNGKDPGKRVGQSVVHSKSTAQMVWADFDENSKTTTTKIASRDKTLMGRGEGNQAKYMETTHTVIALSAHKE